MKQTIVGRLSPKERLSYITLESVLLASAALLYLCIIL